MNKGFGYYNKDSKIKSKQVFKKKRNYTRYYSYLFSSLLGRIILFIISPIFMVSDFRMAKMVREGGDIIVSKCYEPLDSGKKIGNALLTAILSFLIFLAGVIIIAIPAGLMAALGYLICILIDHVELMYTMAILMGIPGALVLVCFMICYPFYIAPAFYIQESISDAYASSSLKNSFKIMRSHQKGCWTMFWLAFVPTFYKLLYLSIAGGIVSYMIYYYQTDYMLVALACVIGILFLLIFLAFAPKLTMRTLISITELIDDLFIERPGGIDTVAPGVQIKKSRIGKVKVVNYKENLVKLFDDTNDYASVKPYAKTERPVYGDPVYDEIEEEIQEEKAAQEVAPIELKDAPLEYDRGERINSVNKSDEAPKDETTQEEVQEETEAVNEEAPQEEEKQLSKKELKALEKQKRKEEKEAAKAQEKASKDEKKKPKANKKFKLEEVDSYEIPDSIGRKEDEDDAREDYEVNETEQTYSSNNQPDEVIESENERIESVEEVSMNEPQDNTNDDIFSQYDNTDEDSLPTENNQQDEFFSEEAENPEPVSANQDEEFFNEEAENPEPSNNTNDEEFFTEEDSNDDSMINTTEDENLEAEPYNSEDYNYGAPQEEYFDDSTEGEDMKKEDNE